MRAVRIEYVFACAAVMVLTSAAETLRADLVVQSGLITFDSLSPTANSVLTSPTRTNRPGAITQMQIATAGITVSISREDGAAFDLVNNFLLTQTGKPDEWGTDFDQDGDMEDGTADRSVSLDAFVDTRNLGFIFSFSDPIQGFSLLAGDFGHDFDELNLTAYTGPNLTGTVVNPVPVTEYLPARPNSPEWTQARFEIIDHGGFQSVLFRGGLNDFDVFVDRVFVSLSGNIPPDDELDDPGIDSDENPLVVPEPVSLSLLAIAGLGVLCRRRA